MFYGLSSLLPWRVRLASHFGHYNYDASLSDMAGATRLVSFTFFYSWLSLSGGCHTHAQLLFFCQFVKPLVQIPRLSVAQCGNYDVEILLPGFLLGSEVLPDIGESLIQFSISVLTFNRGR